MEISEIRSARPMLVHRVAVRLGLSRRMVRHLAATGALPARKQGVKIWGFDPRDVEAYLLRREYRGPK
jgi:helix-turn-helix protein